MTSFYLCFFITLILIQNNNTSAQDRKKHQTATEYDAIPFNCKRWKEIDIIWTDPHHPNYRNHASILRPDRFIQAHRLSSGYTYRSNLSTFGMPDARVMITAIRPLTRARPCHGITLSKKSKPVIGTYSYKTNNVQKFLFENKKGGIAFIHATPSHLFYVYSIKDYLPLNKITSSMKLLDKNNQFISLICPKGKKDDCGKKEQPDKAITVHNIEVYRGHHYFVGKQSILAHNGCESLLVIATRYFVKSHFQPQIERIGTSIDFTYNESLLRGHSIPGARETMMALIVTYNRELESILGDGPAEIINSLKLKIEKGVSSRRAVAREFGPLRFTGALNSKNVKTLYFGSDALFCLEDRPHFIKKSERVNIFMLSEVEEKYGIIKEIFQLHPPASIRKTCITKDILTEIFKVKIAEIPTLLWDDKKTFFQNALISRITR